jgi:hypothetical protein
MMTNDARWGCVWTNGGDMFLVVGETVDVLGPMDIPSNGWDATAARLMDQYGNDHGCVVRHDPLLSVALDTILKIAGATRT